MEADKKELKCLNIKKGLYYINESGDIFSTRLNRNLTSNKDKDGYLRISLMCENNLRKSFRIATLVLLTYKGDCKYFKDSTVNHIDGNKENNHCTNLEWMERGKNSSIRNIKPKGELNGSSILTESQVIEIAELLKEGKLNMVQIGKIYNVKKGTIFNIKRKTTWSYLLQGYDFNIKPSKSKIGQKRQQQEIIELLKNGASPSEIFKKGYSKSVVYRLIKQISKNKI